MQTEMIENRQLRCLCGHLLRAQSEQATGGCIECHLQEHTNENMLSMLLTYAKEQNHGMQPIAHMAHMAITAQRQAMTHYSKTRTPDDADWLCAYDLCEALNQTANALTQWAYVAARLWNALERSSNREHCYLKELHTWSVQQFSRLLSTHLSMQASVQTLCQAGGILLTFRIVDQVLDLSAKTHTDTKTNVSERAETQTCLSIL